MTEAGRGRNGLADRHLVPFLAGYALGNTGDMFTQVAVLWTGLSLSGRAISLAGLGGAWTLALAVMGLLSGPIIDRFNRRNALIWLHGCLSLLSLGLFALAHTGHLRMWHLLAYLIGESLFGVPCGMAFDSILPDLVRKDRLVRVNGLLSSWGMTDNLIEAAVSGVVLALWGPAPIFLFNGIMYLFGSASALFVPASSGVASHRRREDRWHPWVDLRFTVRYIVRERLLDVGSRGYGFFQSLTLGGVLAGSLLASSIGTRWPKVKMWIGGQILYALGFLALGIFVHPVPALGAFLLFGLGCTGGRVYQSTLIQQILPSELRGRVFGIGGFIGGALQPLALALAMMFVDRSGVGIVLAGLAGILLVLSLAQILLLPLREKDWVLAAPPEHARAAGAD